MNDHCLCMMNLPLLYWAADELDDPRFRQVAVNHAKTAQQYVVTGWKLQSSCWI